ncbi:MAG: PPC domain-containing protein [Spirochaetales bacterium]|nr:PPC domain-containing protein [Spirochaetales bacterium]
MKRNFGILACVFLFTTGLFAETVVTGLMTAADTVVGDLPTLTLSGGDLLVDSIQFNGASVKLGDLFSDLLANRLATSGVRITAIKRYDSPEYPPGQAQWLMEGTLYDVGEEYLLVLQMKENGTSSTLFGWEFMVSKQGSQALLVSSTGLADQEWDRFEPNNNREAASLVLPPFEANDLVLGEGDEDWFSIDVPAPESGKIFILDAATTGSLDTYLELYGPGAEEWPWFENDDDDGSNARIIVPLERPGIWYLKVRGYSENESGAYGLSIQFSTEELGAGEPNDNAEQSLPLELGEAEKTNGIIDYVNDQDWYQFELPRNLDSSEVLSLQTFGSLDTVLTLYDQFEGEVIRDDDSGADSNAHLMISNLEPGVYYVAVSAFGESVGQYQLQGELLIPQRDEFEPDDGMGEASLYLLGESPQVRTFSPFGDEDWIGFEIVENDYYIIQTTGDLDTYMELYDEEGNLIEENDDGDEGYNAVIERRLSPGQYIVKITPYGTVGLNDSYGFELNLAE